MKARQIVAGIDVGGRRKGFDRVALGDGAYFRQYQATDPDALPVGAGRWG